MLRFSQANSLLSCPQGAEWAVFAYFSHFSFLLYLFFACNYRNSLMGVSGILSFMSMVIQTTGLPVTGWGSVTDSVSHSG